MIRFVAIILLGLAGVTLTGQGAYIHAKAMLAQLLLHRAFNATIATGRDVKPRSATRFGSRGATARPSPIG